MKGLLIFGKLAKAFVQSEQFFKGTVQRDGSGRK
jgi:hypothetical protein